MDITFPKGYGSGTSLSPEHVDLVRRLELLFGSMPAAPATASDIEMLVDHELVGQYKSAILRTIT